MLHLWISFVTLRQFDCFMSLGGAGTRMPWKGLKWIWQSPAAASPGLLAGCYSKWKLKGWSFTCTLLWECNCWLYRYCGACERDSHHRGELSRAVALFFFFFFWRTPAQVMVSMEAVLAVGKAVWNTIVLSNLSGPAEPRNRPVSSQPPLSGDRGLLADSFLLSYAIRTLRRCPPPLFFLLFFTSPPPPSLVVSFFSLFWSKVVLWLSAGWN